MKEHNDPLYLFFLGGHCGHCHLWLSFPPNKSVELEVSSKWHRNKCCWFCILSKWALNVLVAKFCDIDNVCFEKNESLLHSSLFDDSQLLEMGEGPKIHLFIRSHQFIQHIYFLSVWKLPGTVLDAGEWWTKPNVFFVLPEVLTYSGSMWEIL